MDYKKEKLAAREGQSGGGAAAGAALFYLRRSF